MTRAPTRFLAVKNFETRQHYKDRNPIWIKLYNSVLDDYDFLALPDAVRSQLMLIWLVASRQNNRIPYDAKWIARAIHCTGRLDLDALVESGWLYLTDASESVAESSKPAITPLAEPERNGTAPRARGEGERETEKITATAAAQARDAVRSELPERYQGDLDTALLTCPRGPALVAELQALHDDTHATGTAFSWAEIGLGLHDYVANGQHDRFNARQLRRYAEGARRSLENHTQTNGHGPPNRTLEQQLGRKLTPGEQMYLNAKIGQESR